MTGLELLAFVVLPMSVVALGAAGAFVFILWDRQQHPEPGE